MWSEASVLTSLGSFPICKFRIRKNCLAELMYAFPSRGERSSNSPPLTEGLRGSAAPDPGSLPLPGRPQRLEEQTELNKFTKHIPETQDPGAADPACLLGQLGDPEGLRLGVHNPGMECGPIPLADV